MSDAPAIADWCPNPTIHPTLVRRRFASRIIDQHGGEWVDFLSGWGSNILGYDHPRVLDAIRRQLEFGIGTGVRTEAFAEVEHLLIELIPCAEQVAFGKNGSDATMGAARLARAVTGRDRVLTRGYHGFHDWCLVDDPAIRGIPSSFGAGVGRLEVDDLKSIEARFRDRDHDVAGVMIDPASIPVLSGEVLKDLVDLCRAHGVIVVFDEVVTGFRLAPGGAQEFYGVVPDLACFSKAMANGLPVSALVGRSDLMAELPSTRFGMTFGSEVVSLAAAAATISEIRDRDVCRHLAETGGRLRGMVEAAAAEKAIGVEIVGQTPRPQVLFTASNGCTERELRWLFIQELARQRILTTGIFLASGGHTSEDLDILETAVGRAFSSLSRAVERGTVEGILQPDLLAGVRATDALPPELEPDEPVAELKHSDRFTIHLPSAIRRAASAAVPNVVMRRLRPPPPTAVLVQESMAELLARVPEGFDWRVYLDRYPDLAEAEVATELEAMRHYVLYGAAEGRWGTRESRVAKQAMRCPAVDSLFVRAWGALSCWDDAGAETTIQDFDSSLHYAEDVFYGPVHERIRSSLYENKLPFPGICSRCICLETDVEHSTRAVDQKTMKVLHVEPSYRCALDCPGCIPRHIRKFAPTPRSLEPTMLEKILGDLRGSGVKVETFCYQGHGEPLNHPHIPSLVSLAKSYYPEAHLTINTNANRPFRKELANCGVDEWVCSIDGVDQASYEIYRVGGSFQKAHDFMAAAAAGRSAGRSAKVIWKYVIFEHNDRPEQLLAAQEMGTEIGIDELVFVFTSLGPASNRVTRPGQVPVMEGNLRVSFRAHEPDVADLKRRLSSAEKALGRDRVSEAADLLQSIEATLGRFFDTPEKLSIKYRGVSAELLRLQGQIDGPSEEVG